VTHRGGGARVGRRGGQGRRGEPRGEPGMTCVPSSLTPEACDIAAATPKEGGPVGSGAQ